MMFHSRTELFTSCGTCTEGLAVATCAAQEKHSSQVPFRHAAQIMGCCLTNHEPPKCVADNNCFRGWLAFDRCVELLDILSTWAYCRAAYQRMVDDNVGEPKGEIWVLSVIILLVSWFYTFLFHAFFLCKKSRLCQASACFLCFLTPLLVFLCVGLLEFTPATYATLGWLSLACLLLGSAGLFLIATTGTRMHGEVRDSAGLDIPILSFLWVCFMHTPKLKGATEFRGKNAYSEMLRMAQDVPCILISFIDVNVFGFSWYAVLNLSSSFLALLLYLYTLVEKWVPPPLGHRQIKFFGAVLPS
ncbi:unnamed protein product [Symbiodinium natans]|uniref:Uncharacterized protein n=1 Tax=Symbiodinium natans TaxID=878477 RepID=A0A812L6L2_9DINO|nr:unnamed protein product [Symbiodinium natans]